MSTRPTIQDVANAAGVSKATVSRYLNGHDYVRAEVGKRIDAAVQDLNYRPNPLVNTLMSEVRRNLVGHSGLVLGWINAMDKPDHWSTVDYCRPLYEGARKHAVEMGCRLDSFWTREPGLRASRLQQILLSRGVRGLLIPPASNILKALEGFDWAPFSVVVISTATSDAYPWHSITTDSAANFLTIRDQLRCRGFHRIGLAIAEIQSASDHHVFTGRYLYDQLESASKDKMEPFIYKTDLLHPQCRKNFATWLKKQKPDALICCDQRFPSLLNEMGYDVPKDMALVHLNIAHDVEDWAGINVHSAEKGCAAVDTLLSLLSHNERGVPSDPRTVLIRGNWENGWTAPAL